MSLNTVQFKQYFHLCAILYRFWHLLFTSVSNDCGAGSFTILIGMKPCPSRSFHRCNGFRLLRSLHCNQRNVRNVRILDASRVGGNLDRMNFIFRYRRYLRSFLPWMAVHYHQNILFSICQVGISSVIWRLRHIAIIECVCKEKVPV